MVEQDKDLVKRFCEQSDQKAFETIYEQNFDIVYRFVFSRVGKKELTEDLVSETFLSLIDSIHKYNGKSKLSTFVIGIALNKIRQYCSQTKNQPVVLLDEDCPIFQDKEQDVPDEKKENELAKMLSNVLSKLSKKYRDVLTERFIKGNSIKISAKNLGLSEANLRVIQVRAIKKATQFANELLTN